MKTLKICWVGMLTVILCVSMMAKGAHGSETMSRFLQEVDRLEQQTGALTRWNEDDRNAFQQVMEQYGFVSQRYAGSDDLWSDASVPMDSAYVQAYGDMSFWTLEQSNARDVFYVSLGLQGLVYHVLPAPGEMRPEEAMQIAVREIAANASRYGYSTDDLDQYRVSLQYVRYDNEPKPTYLVRYFHPTMNQIIFNVQVLSDGVATFSYADPESLQAVYPQWRARNRGLRFSFWPLDAKYAFAQLVTEMYQGRDIDWDLLPDIGKAVLGHVHSVPQANEVPEEQAVRTAKQTLLQKGFSGEGIEKCVVCVFFYRDDPQRPVYSIQYQQGTTVVYSVEVNAMTGEAAVLLP